MFFIRSFFVLLSVYRIVYSEWIEITQSTLNSGGIENDRPLVTNGRTPSDYSTYKDFFNIIGPNMELVNLTKNSVFSNKFNNQNGGFHIIMANASNFDDKLAGNRLLMHPSNTSILKSVFSDSIDQMTIEPIQMDSIKIELGNGNGKIPDDTNKNSLKNNKPQIAESDQNPKTEDNRIVFKRLEFKPFNFNNILKFLTNMQQSFAMSSSSGIGDKVKFLMQFKESLLENIG